MGIKDLFTAEEWTDITLAPMLASFAVTASDPSGLVGLFRESAATGWSMKAAQEPAGTLAAAVVAAYENAEERGHIKGALREIVRGRKPAEATAAAIARLAELARVIDAKAPAEADGFKVWISETAHAVAEAATEGGFLGFGGEKVSEAERRTLAEIDTALGLPAA
jgi:biotin carboxylase